ncbi:MAG TPA: hypothetical protein VD887_07925 [Allosphingosinicella sp.]|nr:hypothetical protein [Allosphingosinicella sp.]
MSKRRSAARLPGVKTPQFRTLLLRRLKNMFPDRSVRIEDARHGITFQLFDGAGRPATKRISVYGAHAYELRKRTLAWRVGAAACGADDGIARKH